MRSVTRIYRRASILQAEVDLLLVYLIYAAINRASGIEIVKLTDGVRYGYIHNGSFNKGKHFNPKIMELLMGYEYVREHGKGVDRVFKDMKDAGLPDPEYRQTDFMLNVALKNKEYGEHDGEDYITGERKSHDGSHDRGHDRGHDEGHDGAHDEHSIDLDDKYEMIIAYCETPRTRQEIMDYMKFSSRGQFKDRYLKPLLESGRLAMTIPDKLQSKKQKYVKVALRNNGVLN